MRRERESYEVSTIFDWNEIFAIGEMCMGCDLIWFDWKQELIPSNIKQIGWITWTNQVLIYNVRFQAYCNTNVHNQMWTTTRRNENTNRSARAHNIGKEKREREICSSLHNHRRIVSANVVCNFFCFKFFFLIFQFSIHSFFHGESKNFTAIGVN